ncbi:cytochrome P450 9e2-like [Hyposmocoma kahamanoa]|uniref:cytochrome P450 9e2-like n=1 Tax=Hyposmocoma kahamanoa TaxID=1477025 RepID=UPI000E6D9A71|nr:cytochrome P450 9e2-like [Hyposmocoma kahamanoa]
MIAELLVFLITFLVVYFVYFHKLAKDKFRNCDVKFVPCWPVFGNARNSTVMKRHIFEDLDAVYRAFPDEKYVGYIEATLPVIMVRDPELIKKLTVEDFDHFMDHRQFFPEDVEPLFGGSVLMLQGKKWRNMRMTLSHAFTSSKMRHMMPFMTEISQNIITYLKENLKEHEDVDVGDVIRRYTNDVITSTAFGIGVDSIKNKDNEFFKLGQDIFTFSIWQRILFFVASMWPNFNKKLRLPVFPQKTTDFFKTILTSTIDHRKKNKVERPDMIQLLMEASKGTLKDNSNENEKDSVGFATVDEALKPQGISRKWTVNELTGQVFIFFTAGFESSGSTLVMAIHELTINPHVQDKLYQEIKEFKIKNNDLTYDNIGELKYLDCVLNETLRKWSAALILDRCCTKAYELPPPREGGRRFKLKPGDIVYHAVNSIHLDEKYWPEPEKFDPDRFSDENKHKIKPFTYMPFGVGPRNCLGSRFAILELKVLLFDLISNYKIVKSKKTLDPIVLELSLSLTVKPKGGSFVRLEKRA